MMNIKALRCSSCGKLHTTPAFFCRLCHSEKLEETETPGRGAVYTYSTVHVPIPDLEKETPYTVVIVELNGDLKVTGRLVNPLPEKLAIGALVKLIEIRAGVYLFDFCDESST